MRARVDVEGISVPQTHFIDGRRVDSRESFTVRSPIDWENWELAQLAAGGPEEVDQAVAAARKAFPAWGALGPEGRHAALTRLAAAIDAAVPDLARVECVDNGSLREAMQLAASRDAIAREYADDFAVTFTVSAPALRTARADGLSWADAIVECALTLLAHQLVFYPCF